MPTLKVNADVAQDTRMNDIISELKIFLGDSAYKIFNKFITMDIEERTEFANALLDIQNYLFIKKDELELLNEKEEASIL